MTAPRKSSLKATSNSEGTPSVAKDSKLVSFNSVEIISFPITLGDNPGLSEGAPLTIGWKPTNRTVEDFHVYEYAKKGRKRRRGKKLMIPAVEREVLLLSLGFKMQDILKASELGEKARKERLKSFHNSKTWDRFSGVLETAKTKFFFKSVKNSIPLSTTSAATSTSTTDKGEAEKDLIMVSSRTA
ncbi:expressed unknown protein [Seminavis robusta]|uniref:Uncharacterized protein n=1 Tax=Seminavis robusta TaxID=568900 RepID=A0A9N8DNM8_9STRA|nr:expressed unknown protein [Seminavis robusta]|eukprot:Sro262_g102090.1 n/a (186) ;mRNA; r:75361-76044